MAIDMIERTDEGAHATSRLGNFQFADESKDFKNFTGGEDFFQGGGEDWANLWGINIFGDEYYKKRKRESTEEGKKFVEGLPMKDRTAPTCDEIAKSLEQLQIYSETTSIISEKFFMDKLTEKSINIISKQINYDNLRI